MKAQSSQRPIIYTSLGVGLLGLVIAAFSLYQVNNLATTVDSVSQNTGFEHMLNADAQEINRHIDVRIDAYVDRRKQEKVSQKYDSYELAAEKLITTDKHIYGSESARFTLVEYSDLECPYCKRYHSTPKKVVDASSGLVNWEWKHLPLPFHNPVAAVQAQASECVSSIAGNRAFWVFLQEVFEVTKGNGQGAGDLSILAQNIGVDVDKFTQCVNSGDFREKVAQDLQHAKDLGVSSTPVTFVVDSHTGKNVMLRGAQNPEAIVSTIQRMKKEADAGASENQGENG
ncbi:MAG: thioredoxin domain-containing protein [gamma proteobacterium symbiont of Clathrolucina costata]